MPISDNISVLDAKKDVAIGIDLPLMDDYGSRFKQNYVTLDQITSRQVQHQNLKLLHL